jgi:hypothetical protein
MHATLRKLMMLVFACTILFVGTSFIVTYSEKTENTVSNEVESSASPAISTSQMLFDALAIEDLPYEAFNQAFTGFNKLFQQGHVQNKNILTIIDFSKGSDEERLYIIDLEQQKLIEKTLVAHGRNSGDLNASDFSNTPESYKSSLGFYLTAETYTGKHGYSLRLDGLEKNINDNARERAIVIHGADYVSSDFIAQHGRLGRSFGCPALPQEQAKSIIDTIKNKSCLFIYYPSASYAQQSGLLQQYLAEK